MEAPAPLTTKTISMRSTEMDQPDNNNNNNNNNIELWRQRSNRVTEFANLLGLQTDGSSSNGLSASLRERTLSKMISPSLEDHQVVLTLPSLDLGLSDIQESGSDPLPTIGEHSTVHAGDECGAHPRPTMTASVLTGATDGAANSEQRAAQNIGKLTSWTKSTLMYASDAVKRNVSTSFASLVDSRVRAWTLLLLRHSLSNGDSESRSRLMRMLSSNIKVLSAATLFKTLPLPESTQGHSKEADVILPLLFEVILKVSVQDNEESVTLRAPGTISAFFDENSQDICAIKNVAIRLTSAALLNTMVEQARMVVLKTVAAATKTNVPLDEPRERAGHLATISEATVCVEPVPVVTTTASGLSGFRSALNLTGSAAPPPTVTPSSEEEPPARLQKARVSALRLSSVLHHQKDGGENAAGNLGIRKVRSVKWDNPVQPPRLGAALAPSPKKQRKAINAAKLKSFKSFGRPHAEDGNAGPRNATFGEFERAQMWGRNGRLAHHPMPMQAGNSQFSMGPSNAPSKNATFDILNHSHSSSRAPHTVPSPQNQPVTIPRTTTALEMFVLKKSTSGGKGPTFGFG